MANQNCCPADRNIPSPSPGCTGAAPCTGFDPPPYTADEPPHRPPETGSQPYALSQRLARIKHKILVLSGKGGVGKSTVAVNLASTLARADNRVGLLDVDIHGPSIPKLLGIEGQSIAVQDENILPVALGPNLKAMSIGLLLHNDDNAVIWRGPMKMNLIRQFLEDVAWGDLDYLVIDCPPGTGDEPLSVCQLIDRPDGAVIVTTPQELALTDVRKSINFCHRLDLPVFGIVENMSGFVCPACGQVTDIFKRGGGRQMAQHMDVPFLGSIPIDPDLARTCDDGKPYIQHHAQTPTARTFQALARPILDLNCTSQPETTNKPNKETQPMRIAIPLADGKLALHFGHCREFTFIDVDPDTRTIVAIDSKTPPPHAPGVLPQWLAEQGANLIVAGGMGSRAKDLFAQQNIDVIIGAPPEQPEAIVKSYLDGTLRTGANLCDH